MRYIDHAKNPDMMIGHYTDPFKFKHDAYSYEKEVRILISRQSAEWRQNPQDVRLPIRDLEDFIRSVVVSPDAGDWFYDLINDITRRYGVNVPVRKSSLTNLPT